MSKESDERYTHEYGVLPLLEFMKPFRKKIIWCPFDTEKSEFVKVFKEEKFNVVYSHIDYGQNYYSYEPKEWDVMISNPPFSHKKETFERALSFNKPFALLMTLDWLRDAAPKRLFRNKDLQLLMFEERMEYKNSPDCNLIDFSSAYFCYNFLPKQIIMRSLKDNQRQMKLNLF